MKLTKLIFFILFLSGSLCVKAQSITVGALNFFPPCSSLGSSNQYVGFCIDLMNDICTRLNKTCLYKATAFEKQLVDLDTSTIDLTFSSSPIAPTNNTNYMFSLPYLTSNGQFLTLKNSKINAVDEIRNKKIGALQFSKLQPVLLRYTSEEHIKKYPNITELMGGLADHEIDAILLNANFAKYFIHNSLVGLKLIGDPISLGDGYGLIALKKIQA